VGVLKNQLKITWSPILFGVWVERHRKKENWMYSRI